VSARQRIDGPLGDLGRRLGLGADDLLDAVTAPARWWQELASRDGDAVTELAIELAARSDRPLAIARDRPQRYVTERRVILDHPDPAIRQELMTRLERLWDAAPYVASTAARSKSMRERHMPGWMIELADLLGEVPMRSIRASLLPAEVLRVGDAETVESIVVAERIDRLSEEALAQLELDWLPAEIARLASDEKAKFLRAFGGLHSAAVALLVCYSDAHPRRHARGSTLLAGIRQLNRLVEVAGKADWDPLFGLQVAPGDIELTVGDISDFEAAIEADFYRLLDGLGHLASTKEAEHAARTCTAGLNVLLDVLDAARRAGAHIEALPSVRLIVGEGRVRTSGYLPDGYFPGPEELAEIVALGVDELAAPSDRTLLIAFLVAVVTACRPKECMPRVEDVAPLGAGHLMVYLDHQTGKTGFRELYVPESAIELLGFSPAWFASRYWVDPHPLEVLGLSRVGKRRPRWHKILPAAETDRSRKSLEEACRRVRRRYERETNRVLLDRLAYITRKMLAAYLWRAPIRPADALSHILGHEDLSGDRPYTRQSESEVMEQNRALIAAARTWGVPP